MDVPALNAHDAARVSSFPWTTDATHWHEMVSSGKPCDVAPGQGALAMGQQQMTTAIHVVLLANAAPNEMFTENMYMAHLPKHLIRPEVAVAFDMHVSSVWQAGYTLYIMSGKATT